MRGREGGKKERKESEGGREGKKEAATERERMRESVSTPTCMSSAVEISPFRKIRFRRQSFQPVTSRHRVGRVFFLAGYALWWWGNRIDPSPRSKSTRSDTNAPIELHSDLSKPWTLHFQGCPEALMCTRAGWKSLALHRKRAFGAINT